MTARQIIVIGEYNLKNVDKFTYLGRELWTDAFEVHKIKGTIYALQINHTNFKVEKHSKENKVADVMKHC